MNILIKDKQILTIADLTDSWVIVYIDIADLGKVYLQQKVKITSGCISSRSFPRTSNKYK